MEYRLTEEVTQETTAKTYSLLTKIGTAFQDGLLSENECFQKMKQVFMEGFWDLLRSCGKELHVDSGNYHQFEMEYDSFSNRNRLDWQTHVPWLYDVREENLEADAEEQRQLFRLMEAYGLPPRYFEPVPDGIPVYSLQGIHQYRSAGVWGTEFRCIDDGGLLTVTDPEGKTFRLVNDMGLEAVLTIKDDRRKEDRAGMDFDEQVYSVQGGVAVVLAELLAEGYIEGYTAKERTCDPSVLIRLRDRETRVGWLAFWMDENDEEAFSSFPLWQEYLNWESEKRLMQERVLKSFFQRFVT